MSGSSERQERQGEEWVEDGGAAVEGGAEYGLGGIQLAGHAGGLGALAGEQKRDAGRAGGVAGMQAPRIRFPRNISR
ncbi:MAG TPA: hypothetical protein PKU97_23195, partial [Kofleriaceae bacterium]|nr:hypothetical protein [Kofleriaceae bacterium]